MENNEMTYANGVTIQPLAMFELIVHPAFTSLIGPGEGAYDGVIQDFLVVDDVPNKRPIIDLTPQFNILMREDASCEIVYKRIGTTGLRYVETDEIYGATQNCRHEFYQGALKDFRHNPEVFADKITPFFLNATRTDIASNAWFGDTTRTNSSSLTFSSTIYDGIWKWISTYTGNLIPTAQIFSPATTDYRNPAHYGDAFNCINAAWQLQPVLMRAYPNANKIYYVDQAILDGYSEYMKLLGTTSDVIVMWLEGETKFNSYQGIPIVPVPLWEPMLNLDIYTPVSGVYHHAIILTIRKNFIFATDKNYGEGPDGNEALNIWYRKLNRSWYYQQFLKAGTQIMLPEFIVAGNA
jgi:hypothetical protein